VAVSRDGGTSFRKGAFVPKQYAGDGVFFHAGRGELVSFDQKGLQVSTDGGQTWQTVAVGLTSPSANIDRSQFQDAERITVRVIATNGFDNSVSTSDEMPVESL
jgi:hypothetical protein